MRRQREATQHLKLANLGQQALQPDPAGVGDHAGEFRTIATISEQRVEPPVRAGVETIRHALQGRFVVRGSSGTQDAVEPIRTGSDDPAASEPAADLSLQRHWGWLTRQQLVGEPAAERALGGIVEGGNREVVTARASACSPSGWSAAASSPMAFVNRFGHAPPIAPRGDGRFRMHTIRMGEDAGFSRRSLRLLCGGWLPHDDGASEGCLALATDVGVAACPTRIRGFPLPRPASSLMRIVGCVPQAPSGTRWPMDQTNPSSSRATAAVATTERFPRAVSRL